MDFKQALDNKIADYNLLNHPFYQAWSAGELPVETLRSYAREYGAFISTVPIGWETLDETETAAEEIEHIDLWADFAAGLDTAVAEAQIPQVKALMDTAHTNSFRNLRLHSVRSMRLRHSNRQLPNQSLRA